MKAKSILIFLIITCFFTTNIWSQKSPKLYPKNEVNKDASLKAFVEKIKVAITKKDKAAILPLLDKNVKSSFGGGDDLAYFKKSWWSKESEPSFWFYLERIVNLGGVFGKDSENSYFVFPYVFELELDDADDYFYTGVITGKNVNLRGQPNLKAPIITQLTYDVVKYVDTPDSVVETSGKNPIGDPEWLKVKTWDKKYTGWINYKYIYGPVDCRMFLEKKNGQWKITAFVCGD